MVPLSTLPDTMKQKTLEKMTKRELILENIRLQGDQRKCSLILIEFLKYLSTNKFWCGDRLDGYVSTKEVHSAIMEARRELNV